MPSVNSSPSATTQLSAPSTPKSAPTQSTSCAEQIHADVFGVIMSHLTPKDRAHARNVNQEWNHWLNQGLGVPAHVQVPHLPRTELQSFLGSTEVKFARAVDVSCFRHIDLTDAEMASLVPSRKVRAIDLRLNNKLTSAALATVADRFPNLEYLSLHGCNPAILSGLSSLSENANNLKRVMLSHQGDYGCAAITTFIQESGSQLESLCIAGFPTDSQPSVARTELPEVIAESCPGLKRLALPWHRTLTAEQLDQIVEGCPELTTLHVSIDQLSTDHVDQLLKNNPGLSFLFLNTSYTGSDGWTDLESQYGDRVQFRHSVLPWWEDELAIS